MANIYQVVKFEATPYWLQTQITQTTRLHHPDANYLQICMLICIAKPCYNSEQNIGRSQQKTHQYKWQMAQQGLIQEDQRCIKQSQTRTLRRVQDNIFMVLVPESDKTKSLCLRVHVQSHIVMSMKIWYWSCLGFSLDSNLTLFWTWS